MSADRLTQPSGGELTVPSKRMVVDAFDPRNNSLNLTRLIMAVTVVGFNRLVWHPLSHQAQTRFTLDT